MKWMKTVTTRQDTARAAPLQGTRLFHYEHRGRGGARMLVPICPGWSRCPGCCPDALPRQIPCPQKWQRGDTRHHSKGAPALCLSDLEKLLSGAVKCFIVISTDNGIHYSADTHSHACAHNSMHTHTIPTCLPGSRKKEITIISSSCMFIS